MTHERLDLHRWQRLFPLAARREEATRRARIARWIWPGAGPDELALARITQGYQLNLADTQIVGPHAVAMIEQLRAEAFARIEPGRAVPVDIFVLGRGESAQREITKLGGAPYWPASRPWPVDDQGEPLRFLGQLNFADSRDVVPALPGDLLLIFLRRRPFEAAAWEEASGMLQFVWLDPVAEPLIAAEHVPPGEPAATSCYGVIHRSADYPGIDEALIEDPDWAGIAVWRAVKIGGVPWWIQYPEELPGQFLAMITTTDPEVEVPYPFINVPAPRRLMDSTWQGPEGWNWGYCCLIFFIDGSEVHWTLQCT